MEMETDLTPNQRAGRTRRNRTRQQVLDAAHGLLAGCEYDDLRVADIAAAAGVGEATLYQVFRHKGAVIGALYVESYQAVEAAAQRELGTASVDAVTVLRNFLSGIVDLTEADPALSRAYLRALLSEAYMRSPLPDALADLMRPSAFTQELIDRALHAGQLTPSFAVDGLGELLLVAIVQTVLRQGPDHGSAAARRFINTIVTSTSTK
jgi:AcrR family transcriptional regulator